jgi:hypothetical protein
LYVADVLQKVQIVGQVGGASRPSLGGLGHWSGGAERE